MRIRMILPVIALTALVACGPATSDPQVRESAPAPRRHVFLNGTGGVTTFYGGEWLGTVNLGRNSEFEVPVRLDLEVQNLGTSTIDASVTGGSLTIVLDDEDRGVACQLQPGLCPETGSRDFVCTVANGSAYTAFSELDVSKVRLDLEARCPDAIASLHGEFTPLGAAPPYQWLLIGGDTLAVDFLTGGGFTAELALVRGIPVE
jgi:hypothetical protein